MRLMLIVTVAYATVLFGNDTQEVEVSKAKAKLDRTSDLSPIKERSPAHTNSRNSSFVSYKIDSSKKWIWCFFRNN